MYATYLAPPVSVVNPIVDGISIPSRISNVEFFKPHETISELSLSRALNSLLPPSLKAAEIHAFKPKSKPRLNIGSDDTNDFLIPGIKPRKSEAGDGSGGPPLLFTATHLPPRELVRKLATKLNTCLGTTFFIVESLAEVEYLIERVYAFCDHEEANRQRLAKPRHGGGALPLMMGSSPPPPTTGEVCELLAMAAVGAMYVAGIPASLRQTCFDSARFGLDDAIEEAEEENPDLGVDACYRVLRLLALLAVYQILEKRGSCWRYIGTGLSIARSRNLDHYDGGAHRPLEGLPEGKHTRMRRIWGTLVCLESWIGGTLGKPPSTKINLAERIAAGDPVFCFREEIGNLSTGDRAATRALQTALVRIAVLTAAIQRSIYPSPSTTGSGGGGSPNSSIYDAMNSAIDLPQTRFHMTALNAWFHTLHPSLHLRALLVSDPDTDPTQPSTHSSCPHAAAVAFSQRSSMLLGHCLYLSAMMLLTRRIFLAVVNDPEGGYGTLHGRGDMASLSPERREALGYVSSCLMAANVTGRVMGLMVMEGRLISKCWLAIYPSFNACLLLLFHLTQRKLFRDGGGKGDRDGGRRDGMDWEEKDGGDEDTDTQETMENAKKCLATLEFCARGGDELSKWYLQVLSPFRQVLGEAEVAPELDAENYPNQQQHTSPTFTHATTETETRTTLSTNIYNILAVSTQCAFLPDSSHQQHPLRDSYLQHPNRPARSPTASASSATASTASSPSSSSAFSCSGSPNPGLSPSPYLSRALLRRTSSSRGVKRGPEGEDKGNRERVSAKRVNVSSYGFVGEEVKGQGHGGRKEKGPTPTPAEMVALLRRAA